jgi:IclR family transcriptional regulator, KDG regulon repressor
MKLNSIDKSLQIVELLSKYPSGLRLSELATKSGFPKSTIHHILSTFLPYEYIAKDSEAKKYSLGFRFLSISKSILDNMDIRKIAHNHLFQLHEECTETVHLAILRNGKVVYIDKIDKPRGLSLTTYVGFYTEPHAAAGGKVLLSELPMNKIREIYQRTSLKKYGKNTITRLDKLVNELKKIRKDGYAIDDEEYYEGVRCVAAPIRAGGQVVASVSITGSIFTMTMERINSRLRKLVMKTAEMISSEMRW